MRGKVIISCLLFLLLSIMAIWEGNLLVPRSEIVWERYRPLKWKDFKGYVLPFSRYYAVISCDIKVTYECPEKPVAYAYMSPHESWTKNNGQPKKYDLRHEQYHFNIAQIYALKLQKQIDQLDNVCSKKSQVMELEEKYRRWMNDTQVEYDEATKRGLDSEAQAEWQRRINKDIVSLMDIN